MTKYDVEKHIPHRDTMKLIDEIQCINDEIVISKAIVTERWPSFEEGSISPLMLVEVVAQTVSFAEGWRNRDKVDDGGKGFLVGVKNADFYIEKIPVHSEVTAKVKTLYSISDKFRVSEGEVKIGDELIANIVIQAVRPDFE